VTKESPREDREDSVSLTVKVGSDGGFAASAKLPASLPRSVLQGVANAFRFGLAGLSPKFFDRASVTLGRAKIREALLGQIISNAGNDAESDRLADLLALSLGEQELRIEKRGILLQQTVEHLRHPEARNTNGLGDIISDEFLTHFWATADTISQAQMREVFGRILAREIRSPGAFSASTLNLLATLHPQLAERFVLLCSMTFSFNGFVFVIISMPHEDGPHTIVNALGTSKRIGEQMADFGLTREDMLDMRSAGLIRSLPEEEYPTLNTFFEAPHVDFAGGRATLDVGSKAREQAGLAIVASTNVISLTRSGAELREILDLRRDPAYAEALRVVMDKAGVKFNYS
jgi:hypothetical protein